MPGLVPTSGFARWTGVVALAIAAVELAACAHVVETPTGAIVQMKATVDIKVPVESAYAFAANAANDALWRDEVVRISGAPTMYVGGRYTEYAKLGPDGHHVTITKIQALNAPNSVRYATASGAAPALAVERTFAAIGPAETRFTYRVSATTELVGDLTAKALPNVLAGSFYQMRMRRYQRHLRALLEDGE